MKIKNIHWIYHGNNRKKKLSIFSLDIQPFGNLIATAGQDSFVKIWERYFIFSDSNFSWSYETKTKKYKNKQIKIPSFILESNIGQVNTIRWATNGCFFATGGDDGYLNIYEKVKNPYQKQMWRIFQTFKHHITDIIDLAWSPNNLFLASGSLDNCVLIWAVEKKSLIVKLSGHSSWIKGLCWNSTGKYLATQGADKKIIIWRTKSWSIEKILDLKNKNRDKKNEEKIDLFSRSNWSSCGEYLIIGNTTYKNKNSVLIMGKSRNFLKSKIFFGERFLLKIISPNPRLFKFDFTNSINSYFSAGSTGGNLILWNPTFSNPNFKILNLNKNQIVDISWCYFGHQMLVGFLDGTVIGIKLNKIELGKRLKKKDHLDFLKIFSLMSKKSNFFSKNLFLNKSFMRKKNFKKIKKYADIIFLNMKFETSFYGNFHKSKLHSKKDPKILKEISFSYKKKNKLVKTKKKKFNTEFKTDTWKKMLHRSLIFIREKNKKIANFTFGYEFKFLNSKYFTVRLWCDDQLTKNLELFIKKKKYYLKEKINTKKKTIKFFSKPFFIAIQENYLKVIDCDGMIKILLIECLPNFFSIYHIPFLLNFKSLSNLKKRINLKKSSGLMGFA